MSEVLALDGVIPLKCTNITPRVFLAWYVHDVLVPDGDTPLNYTNMIPCTFPV